MASQLQEVVNRGRALVADLVRALSSCRSLPVECARQGLDGTARPSRAQSYVLRQANKLEEDSAAVLLLLEAGRFGPAQAMLRICRENVINMLYVGQRPDDDSEDFLEYLVTVLPNHTAARRHGTSVDLLDQYGERMDPGTRALLEAAILSEKELQKAKAGCEGIEKVRPKFTFAKRVKRTVDVFLETDFPQAGALLKWILDYGLESDLIHSSHDTWLEYGARHEIDDDPLDAINSQLLILADLREVIVIAHASLLAGFGLVRRIPMPPQIVRLREVQGRADDYNQILQRWRKRCSPHAE